MKTQFFAVALLAATSAYAQHHAHENTMHGGHASSPSAPYAGMQGRSIKSFSAQQIADLRSGKGLAMALPAELNGYPGPAHVLELAEALDLSTEQKSKTQTLFERMQAEARSLGERWIEREAELDALFRENRATETLISEAAANAARAQGELRAAHLRYHLYMLEVLQPVQIDKYKQLRGYR